MVESNELKAAISHVYSLIHSKDLMLLLHSCCPTLFHPHSSLSAGLYIGLSVCLTVLTTVLTVPNIAAVPSTVLSVLSTVLSVLTNVLTNVLTVLYRCKPSVPMSKQVLTAVWRMESLHHHHELLLRSLLTSVSSTLHINPDEILNNPNTNFISNLSNRTDKIILQKNQFFT